MTIEEFFKAGGNSSISLASYGLTSKEDIEAAMTEFCWIYMYYYDHELTEQVLKDLQEYLDIFYGKSQQ